RTVRAVEPAGPGVRGEGLRVSVLPEGGIGIGEADQAEGPEDRGGGEGMVGGSEGNSSGFRRPDMLPGCRPDQVVTEKWRHRCGNQNEGLSRNTRESERTHEIVVSRAGWKHCRHQRTLPGVG